MSRPKRPVRCVETGVEYDSVKAAAEAYGCWYHLIWKAVSGRNKTSMGYHWEYI